MGVQSSAIRPSMELKFRPIAAPRSYRNFKSKTAHPCPNSPIRNPPRPLGYRPMTTIDQTTHFLRPVTFDVIADARVVRIGRTTSFGRVMMMSATDKRPVRMVTSAYAML
jgi:acyl-coenzyme A thioesterase PaaI-like protein